MYTQIRLSSSAMATMASTLLRAARRASLASRAAAAAASRAAAMASRSARAAGVAAGAARAARLGSGVLCPLKRCPTRGEASTKPRDGAPSRFASAADYAHLPDDAKTPTDMDLESDEALRSLYERWCKAFNKERDQRDHAEMDRRFKLFRYSAKYVHYWNTFVPKDPEEAAIYLGKRREAELLLSKDEDISHFDECYLPIELGAFADGGDPYFNERDMSLLKAIEEPDVKVSLWKSQTLNEMN